MLELLEVEDEVEGTRIPFAACVEEPAEVPELDGKSDWELEVGLEGADEDKLLKRSELVVAVAVVVLEAEEVDELLMLVGAESSPLPVVVEVTEAEEDDILLS